MNKKQDDITLSHWWSVPYSIISQIWQSRSPCKIHQKTKKKERKVKEEQWKGQFKQTQCNIALEIALSYWWFVAFTNSYHSHDRPISQVTSTERLPLLTKEFRYLSFINYKKRKQNNKPPSKLRSCWNCFVIFAICITQHLISQLWQDYFFGQILQHNDHNYKQPNQCLMAASTQLQTMTKIFFSSYFQRVSSCH